MKGLSLHSDTAKAFACMLKQRDALNLYCSNGWVEIDINIAENALNGVAPGRENWLRRGRRTCCCTVFAERHLPAEQCGAGGVAV